MPDGFGVSFRTWAAKKDIALCFLGSKVGDAEMSPIMSRGICRLSRSKEPPGNSDDTSAGGAATLWQPPAPSTVSR